MILMVFSLKIWVDLSTLTNSRKTWRKKFGKDVKNSDLNIV